MENNNDLIGRKINMYNKFAPIRFYDTSSVFNLINLNRNNCFFKLNNKVISNIKNLKPIYQKRLLVRERIHKMRIICYVDAKNVTLK